MHYDNFRNEILRIAIAPKGAELQSLFNKTTSTEHIWSGDAAYWANTARFYFPLLVD
ncbi:MAG: hypothetical protein WDM90_17390 [Ferruginibacter sp.]